MEIKKYWSKVEDYHTVEVQLYSNYLEVKDWFDPGKDPNKYKYDLNEVLEGQHDQFLMENFSKSKILEIKESILKLK